MNKKYEGLLLPAGGINGFTILGFLDILYNEENIKSVENIKYFGGTSSGSIITYLLAIGYTPREIFLYVTKNDVMDLFKDLSILSIQSKWGLIDIDIIKKYLEIMSLQKLGYVPTFNELYIKLNKFFICNAYNISEKNIEKAQEYFTTKTHGDMKVIDAVILSCSAPIIFTKSSYKDNFYIDGGIFDQCPDTKLVELFNLKNEEIMCIKYDVKNYLISIECIYSYIKRIVEVVTQSKIASDIVYDKFEHVLIEYSSKTSFNFVVSKKERLDMFLKGQNGCKKYYNIKGSDFDSLSNDNIVTITKPEVSNTRPEVSNTRPEVSNVLSQYSLAIETRTKNNSKEKSD